MRSEARAVRTTCVRLAIEAQLNLQEVVQLIVAHTKGVVSFSLAKAATTSFLPQTVSKDFRLASWGLPPLRVRQRVRQRIRHYHFSILNHGQQVAH